MVRQWILDPSHVGSNPTTPKKRACNSMVEYSLDKREVGSSILLKLIVLKKYVVILRNINTRSGLSSQ